MLHYKHLQEILSHSIVHMHGIQYWTAIAIAEGRDPTYHGVQFTENEASPMYPEGHLLDFELPSTDDNVSPQILSNIRVLTHVRFCLSRLIFKDPCTFEQPVDDETPTASLNIIYGNLYKMDMYLSSLVDKYRGPSKMLRNWIPITAGAFAVASLSIWILYHSEPLDIDIVTCHFTKPAGKLREESDV